jgi:hypothetical protein
MAGHTPKSIQFGLVDLHFFGETGPMRAWIVTYSVDLPSGGGAPSARVGPPNIKTTEFVVGDLSGTVLEATGYFD